MAKNLKISLLLDFYGPLLTEKQQEAVEFYYNQDLSLAEIASHSGITRQGVRDSIKRAEAQLLEYEQSLKLLERYYVRQEKIQTIVLNAETIEAENRRFGGSQEIASQAAQIIDTAKNLNT